MRSIAVRTAFHSPARSAARAFQASCSSSSAVSPARAYQLSASG
jgi:hypothetical protein